MKLDRSINPKGKGKYALIKLREMPEDTFTLEELAQAIIDNPKAVDFGWEGSDSEFFVIRLKDKYAVAALENYAIAAQLDGEKEWAKEVMAMADRARRHPNKKQPD